MRWFWSFSTFVGLAVLFSLLIAQTLHPLLLRAEKGIFPFSTEFIFDSNESKDSQTILFGGDLMLARGVEWAMQDYGCAYPYEQISEIFEEHTNVVVNFEASIPTEHVPTPAMNFSLSVHPRCISALADAGITHTTLANNHSFDFGYDEYTNTVKTLEVSNIATFGKPYTIATSSYAVIDGKKRIALIGIDLTLRSYTKEELAPIFESAGVDSDLQVAIVHWGNEYILTHASRQQHYAQLFVELGADLVIGHHPHVVQDIAVIDGVPIFYSLGNLIFDQYFSNDVQEGLLLSLDLDAMTIKLIPITSLGSRNQPRMMPKQEKEIFLKGLAKRSQESLRNAILEGTLTF